MIQLQGPCITPLNITTQAGTEGEGAGGSESSNTVTGAAAAARTSGSGAFTSSSAAPEDLAPPYIIMEHLPLAALTNGVLTALNELRQCAMLGLCKPAAR